MDRSFRNYYIEKLESAGQTGEMGGLKKTKGKVLKSYDLSNMSVLVLEHHSVMRRLLVDVLKHLGIRHVNGVGSVEDAWDMVQRNDYDLLMVDWGPNLNGRDFVRRVRQSDSPNPFVPVLMISAFAEQQHVNLARDAGMHEFLRKPVSAKLIYSRICSLIENDRLFIKTKDFFGPNRRRRLLNWQGRDRRSAFVIPFPDRRAEARDIAHDERRGDHRDFDKEDRKSARIESLEDVIDLSTLSDDFPVSDAYVERETTL